MLLTSVFNILLIKFLFNICVIQINIKKTNIHLLYVCYSVIYKIYFMNLL